MDRTTEDIATLVPTEIIEHYKNSHLNLDLLFMNKVPFFLGKPRDIGFIHCKAILTKSDR